MRQTTEREAMEQYLVGVEHPCEFCNALENIIKVTDDIEGFGPGLLADYPILPVEADTPHLAGYRYMPERMVLPTYSS